MAFYLTDKWHDADSYSVSVVCDYDVIAEQLPNRANTVGKRMTGLINHKLPHIQGEVISGGVLDTSERGLAQNEVEVP